jgi:hypothetical protein
VQIYVILLDLLYDISYKRRMELEGTNCYLVIVDLFGNTDLRIKTIYITFKPQDNFTAREKFGMQWNLIKLSCTKNFNVDHAKKYYVTYEINIYSMISTILCPTWDFSNM